jgi:pseudaminic acid synthase
MSIRIGNRPIGTSEEPFLIAELSGNHNQSLDRALAIVDAAADAGAHAIKLQTYTADTLTVDSVREEFVIHDPRSLWNGKNLYQLYNEAHTPWEWHKAIFDHARSRGLQAFSTPFDDSAVEFLETLGVPCYKIASFESTHLPLLKRVAKTGKPIVISLGMATLAEADECLRTLREAGAAEIVLLKCTSTYPASPLNTNLRTIPHLRDMFGCEVGLSDHTMGTGVAVASVAFGATVIEKHMTLRRADGGVDSAFSMEPEEFALLVKESRAAWQSLGKVQYGPTADEKPSLVFRRSIYVVEEIPEGGEITSKNVRIIRPGYGLKPRHWDSVLGRRVRKAIAAGTPLTWDLI